MGLGVVEAVGSASDKVSDRAAVRADILKVVVMSTEVSSNTILFEQRLDVLNHDSGRTVLGNGINRIVASGDDPVGLGLLQGSFDPVILVSITVVGKADSVKHEELDSFSSTLNLLAEGVVKVGELPARVLGLVSNLSRHVSAVVVVSSNNIKRLLEGRVSENLLKGGVKARIIDGFDTITVKVVTDGLCVVARASMCKNVWWG